MGTAQLLMRAESLQRLIAASQAEVDVLMPRLLQVPRRFVDTAFVAGAEEKILAHQRLRAELFAIEKELEALERRQAGTEVNKNLERDRQRYQLSRKKERDKALAAAQLADTRKNEAAEADRKRRQSAAERQAALNRKTAGYIDDLARGRVRSVPPSKAAAKQAKTNKNAHYQRNLQLSRVPAPVKPDATPAPPPVCARPAPSIAAAARKMPATVDCSCGGTNERCFRCDGRGYYESGASAKSTPMAKPGRSAASFASDYRGAAYGIRENGKFSSLPLHDDYGDTDG